MSPLPPLRLPSLTSHDQHGVPWAEAINESLRLSHFPVPPRGSSPQDSQMSLPPTQVAIKARPTNDTSRVNGGTSSRGTTDKGPGANGRPVEIRIQQPTSITSPRPSTSLRATLPENVQPSTEEVPHRVPDEEEGESPRHSVHL